jgi:hypothetical protein
LEWWVPGEHFVKKNAESPPVDWLAVALVEKNLWRDVLRRAADSVGTFGADLGEAKVYQLKIAIGMNHNILGLEIAIDNLFALQVLKNGNDLCTIELCLLAIKVAHTPMICK